MKLNELCDTYSCCFKLVEGKNLKDLEPYGFEPTYDSKTGELALETLYVKDFGYIREVIEPVMCIALNDMEVKDCIDEKSTTYNPLQEKILNFFNIKKRIEYKKWANCVCQSNYTILNIDFKKFETIQMSVLLTLIEDGIIERSQWNNKDLNFGRKILEEGNSNGNN